MVVAGGARSGLHVSTELVCGLRGDRDALTVRLKRHRPTGRAPQRRAQRHL